MTTIEQLPQTSIYSWNEDILRFFIEIENITQAEICCHIQHSIFLQNFALNYISIFYL